MSGAGWRCCSTAWQTGFLVLAGPATHKQRDLGHVTSELLTPYLQNGDSHPYLRGYSKDNM